MSSASTAVLHGWKHESVQAAKHEIFRGVGNIDGIEVFGTQVLIGVYLRPTMYGSIITMKESTDDRWQGKVGMILKFGHEAFRSRDTLRPTTMNDATATELQEAHARFGGRLPEIGDLVFHDIRNCWQVSVCGEGSEIDEKRLKGDQWHKGEGWPCRLVYMADIYGRVTEPHILV